VFVHRSLRGHGGAQNPVNLMVGSGMQQAHGLRGGATRHGGEKPRSRPATASWQRLSEAHFGAWERIPRRTRRRGEIFGQPYGRRSTRVEPSRARSVFESKAFVRRRAEATSVTDARYSHGGIRSPERTGSRWRRPVKATELDERDVERFMD